MADVYLLMTGGQASLLEEEGDVGSVGGQQIVRLSSDRPRLKVIRCTEDELRAHQTHLQLLEKVSGGCIWNK